MGDNTGGGHKFNSAKYEPIGLYPEYNNRHGITHVKFQECPCGVRRVVTKGPGFTSVSIYYIGNKGVSNIPACVLKRDID